MNAASLSREVVTDANLWLNVVLAAHPTHNAAQQLVADCLASGVAMIAVAMIAPAWWQAEADSALRGMVRGGLLTSDAGRAAQRLLDAAPVTVVHEAATRLLARRIADAAKRHDVYDTTYAALAVVRDCEFWTADKRFFNAIQNEARGVFPVRLVESYAGEYAVANGTT